MRKFLMKYFMISCKEATFLITKKEERALSLKQQIQLAVHASMCSFCKKFETQSKIIHEESKHIISDDSPSDEARKKIENILMNHLEK